MDKVIGKILFGWAIDQKLPDRQRQEHYPFEKNVNYSHEYRDLPTNLSTSQLYFDLKNVDRIAQTTLCSILLSMWSVELYHAYLSGDLLRILYVQNIRDTMIEDIYKFFPTNKLRFEVCGSTLQLLKPTPVYSDPIVITPIHDRLVPPQLLKKLRKQFKKSK